MAAPLVALGTQAASLATRYGPSVVSAAQDLLRKSTGGKVAQITPTAINSYVNGNATRGQVVVEQLVRAGFDVDDLLPQSLVTADADLAKLRADVINVVGAFASRVKAEAFNEFAPAGDDVARDVLRTKRVKSALAVFGSKDAYFACQGLSPDDFVWYDRVILGRAR